MLNKYKKNYYSQNGEDGIILEIFKRLKLKKKIFNGVVNLEHGMESMEVILLI